MIHQSSFARVGLSLLLTFGIFVFATETGRTQPLTPEQQRAKEIAELEQQLFNLQMRLKDLKSRELLTVPPRVIWHDLLPEAWTKNLGWRCVGPATMGGRITSLAVYEADPTTYWVATASGGLLKTTNNGFTFKHQFDKQDVVSIGSVAVAPSNRDIVWVGTGEANPRNSVSYGNGVYKSVDGGETWKNMGLKQSFQIGKILVHPKNPDVVYVGALGRLYGMNAERGLFKTTDGGKTWKNVLFVDEKTGVIDFAMHPTDPETLIVAAWERKRDEFDSFRGDAKAPVGVDEYAPVVVHGPGSGLYRTMDGGRTFQKLSKGLPTVKMGRIGLDYSRKNPNTIYATIDTERAGMGKPPVLVFMGIRGVDASAPGGAKLTSITEGGPAEKAGLKVDDVVVQFAGVDVKSFRAMLDELEKKKPEDKVKITILRGKERKELEVTLGRRGQQGPGGGGPGSRQQRGTLGVQIAPVEDGVIVTDVTDKGPAQKAGMKAEDLILSVEGVPIANERALFKVLLTKRPDDKVKVVYQRGKDRKEVEMTLVLPSAIPSERPYTTRLGGNQANVQDEQGPDGFQTGGIFRSTDNGETWTRVNSLNSRPFYFSVVRVDPVNDNIVYALGVNLARSTDGGNTFTSRDINNGVHSDQHDMWINPKDPRHIIMGTDGGFYVTHNRCAHWDHMNHAAALGQFYHVAVDNQKPYRVYGGLQDNGSWGGPSHAIRGRGPINEDWITINGGDGFVCRVDPTNPNLVYAESQDGNLMRRNLKTGESFEFAPRRVVGMGGYRFNWNTPFILSSQNPSVYYTAGNYVFRSLKQGEDLRMISPEITRTKRGSATALVESPKNPQVLWVGTDDGAVWVTKDGGKVWTNVTANFKPAGLPGPFWVSSIEASHEVAGRAYVVFDAHRSNDDEPYLYVTEDFGASWTSLRANLPTGSSRVLREDITNPNLLYVGTEFACYASINCGKSWNKINGSTLPTVAIHEFAQPTTANELVVATHGRSIWILDLTPLRQMTPKMLAEQTPALFASPTVVRWQAGVGRGYPFSSSARKYHGENPTSGATISYCLPAKAQRVTLKVEDLNGQPVAELKAETDSGLHRVNWGLNRVALPRLQGKGKEPNPGTFPFAEVFSGADVKVGTYKVILIVDGKTFSQFLTIENDPNAAKPTGSGIDEVEENEKLRKLFEDDDDVRARDR